jgi:hypothetical protein
VKAWQAILDSSVPVTLGDQAVCKKHLLMTRASARALWRGHGPSGDYLAGLLVDHIEKNGGLNAREGPDKDYWPIWDSVTVAHLMGLAQSKTYPRPSLSDDLLLRHPERPDPKRTIRWIVSLDEKRLWADFVEQLERARRQGP